MTADRTYTEAVSEFGERMARMEGKLDTGLAELTGSIKELTVLTKASDEARVAQSTIHSKDIESVKEQQRQLDKDNGALATRISHVEATSVTLKQLLGGIAVAIGAAVGLMQLLDRIGG